MPRREKTFVSQSVKFIKLVVLSGATGIVKSSALKIGANFVIRQVSITSDGHNINRDVTVHAGSSTVVDHMPDQQTYETAPLPTPETGIEYDQDAEVVLEITINTGGVPAADVTYLVAIDYWEVLPERR